MHGWMFSCIEKLIITKYGETTWDNVKKDANCKAKNGEWVRYQKYKDDEIFAILDSASKLLNIDIDSLLEMYGHYFIQFVIEEGYYDMLSFVGTNLRDWLSNINDIHNQLKPSLPNTPFPNFWCLADEDEDGVHESMILYYISNRGLGSFASMNVGIVKEAARIFFKLNVEMTRLTIQGVDGAEESSWRIVIMGPADEKSQAAAHALPLDSAKAAVNKALASDFDALRMASAKTSVSVGSTSTGECPFKRMQDTK